jgi:hypothetical protein
MFTFIESACFDMFKNRQDLVTQFLQIIRIPYAYFILKLPYFKILNILILHPYISSLL